MASDPISARVLGDQSLDQLEPKVDSYDPTRNRETVRAGIAVAVLALLFILIVFSLAIAAFLDDAHFDRVAKLLDLLLSPVVALAGAVTGFYYGERASRPG